MTSPNTELDQELAQFGWMESKANNSIINFKSPKSNFLAQKPNEKNSDAIHTFIVHIIFYLIFCYSVFLYVVIDLGFGSFIKSRLTTLIKFSKTNEKPFLNPTPSS